MDQLNVKRKTFDLHLTKYELVHLRDLFNVGLPPELKQTVSQALANTEGRTMVEARLWQKISAALVEADLPRDDAAPDFIVAPCATVACDVFRLPDEPMDGHEGPNTKGTLFDGEDEEDVSGDD